MNKLQNRSGDTLIEVIFAFAILGTIIGFSFTGVIQARKSAIAAQQRTQASMLVEKQTAAVKAYRDSLPWDDEGVGSVPNFLNGNPTASSSADLPNIVTGSGARAAFCLYVPQSGNQWSMLSTMGGPNQQSRYTECFTNLTPGPYGFQADQSTFCVQVLFSNVGQLNAVVPPDDPSQGVCLVGNSSNPVRQNSTSVKADIGVFWEDPFGNRQSVKNIVILNKQR